MAARGVSELILSFFNNTHCELGISGGGGGVTPPDSSATIVRFQKEMRPAPVEIPELGETKYHNQVRRNPK